MTLLGIVCGLWAAFFQALAYFASRHYVTPRGGGSRELLVLSHVWMGLAALVGLALSWPDAEPDWLALWEPLVQVTAFYLLGQMGLMLALKYAQPSQVSPILALKLLVLAGMTVLVSQKQLHTGQWLAVLLCLGGTFLANHEPGKRPTFLLVLIVLLPCFFYALSDWNIGRLNVIISGGETPTMRAVLFASSASYVLCGLVGAAFLPLYGSRSGRDWRDAAPFAAIWFLGVLGLYACFGLIGVLYGNILQSTRAIMAVGLAALFVSFGWEHLERKSSRGTITRRLIAALMVTAAVILYRYSEAG
jgi:hypothetical protein